jgi:hypothetical protein
MPSERLDLTSHCRAIADFERDLIRERTGEGGTRAVANGVKLVASASYRITSAEAVKRRNAGDTLAAIAKSYYERCPAFPSEPPRCATVAASRMDMVTRTIGPDAAPAGQVLQ